MTARDFFRDSTGTVRPPWRLAIFAASTFGSLIVINGAVVPMVSGVLALAGVRVVLYPWVLLASAVAGHLITFHWVEPRRWRSARLDAAAWRPRAVGWAASLGAVAVAVPSAVLLAVGWLAIEAGPAGSSILAALSIALFLAPAALWEELVFRGYGFTVLAEWWGTPAALAITSTIFGVLHLSNAGATAASILVVVLAGVFLGGVLVVTGSLYAAFAAHFAWNWTLAAVMHSAVSGVPFTTPDYRVVDAGPDWATGGTWGPEGGAGALVGLLSATFYLYRRRTRREEPWHD